MAISFACENCGKPCKVGDELAGRTGRCGACGHLMAIPGTAVGPSGRGERMSWGKRVGVALATLVVVSMLARLLLPAFQAAREASRKVQRERAEAKAREADGPIALPSFPGRGEGREIEPGVIFREVVLGPAGRPPGQGGKLWLYLPSGEHEAGSLPCVLIAPAGSTLLSGMALGESDRPEHIPYAQAGFAVLAFELDGALDDEGGRGPSEAEFDEAARRFLAARAGLVNARVALEYVLAKVPEVDPRRVAAAGHSSAGTLAVLFAENEPRLAACVAFAPALDLGRRFGSQTVAQLTRAGLGDLAVRYSPTTDAAKLACPLFLFHARDDATVPASPTEAFAARLQGLGKSVTLDLVDAGGHYRPMIDPGIPRAIDWLESLPPPEKP